METVLPSGCQALECTGIIMSSQLGLGPYFTTVSEGYDGMVLVVALAGQSPPIQFVLSGVFEDSWRRPPLK